LSNFVHLHNHTDFSLLDGAASIPKYIAKCKETGMKALAITDHGNMYGAVTFYKECRANGINPLVGCEFYYTHDRHVKDSTSKYFHLILIAMSDKGYHNLMELNSIAWKEGYYYKPRIDDESLASHSEDLICLSACLAGEIPRLIIQNNIEEAKRRIGWFKSVFGDRYYLELQDHGLDEDKIVLKTLPVLAREMDVPLVCTNDIHYIDKSDSNAHDTLICIGTQAKKTDKDRLRYKEGEFYFRTPKEMEELFSWCPEAIENTAKVAERCHLEINFPGPILPKCQIPPEYENDAEYLTALSYEGLKMRYPDAEGEELEKLKERLQHELDIIIKMDFPAYFLIVRDYIHWAKTHDIPVGPGRGSGAGSLVAYTTTITDVDPIKYNLLFERFLNPERVSLPDFDVDFCFERRGEVIDYVTEHYGHDSVGQIVTFGTLKPKAVLKDVARVLDIPFDESNKITSLVPDEIPGVKHMHVTDALKAEPKLQEIRDRGGVYEELFDTAIRLDGLNRHTSLHAAGVVIGREPLDRYVPLCVPDQKTGGLASQYTMLQIEECGLVKMDFLGLKTLTLLKHAVDLIHKREPGFDLNRIPTDDQNTFNMLRRGDSSYVFQFESSGMQEILKRAKPDSIEDLVALNALYRPGPMQFIDKYINSKLGITPITYADPALEPILKTTYGVIVYQEQVMQTAQIIAGYTLGEADILRRIMGKKKVEALEKELDKFIRKAVEKGHTKEHAVEIFEYLKPFAGYGFNKSHAVAYSIVAYQTAFLKANYNTEFLAANLTNEMNSPDKFKEYLNLAPKYGIKVVPPSINRSETQFSVDNGDIIYGLAAIKNVGSNIVDSIISERRKNGPYKSFMDFLSRQGENSLNSRLLECLIKTGCFDELGVDRAVLLANLDDALRFDKAQKSQSAFGQLSLFGEEETMMNTFEMKDVPPFPHMEKLKMEKDLLGFYISGHPLDTYNKEIEECMTVNLSDLDTVPWNSETQIIGQVIAMRTVLSKKGNNSKLAFLTIQTRDGDAEAVIFPKSYETLGGRAEADGIYGFKGKFDRKDGKMSFIINDIVSPRELEPIAVEKVHIRLSSSAPITKEGLEGLRRVLLENEGKTPVYLSIDGIEGEELQLKSTESVEYSHNLYTSVTSLDVVTKMWVN